MIMKPSSCRLRLTTFLVLITLALTPACSDSSAPSEPASVAIATSSSTTTARAADNATAPTSPSSATATPSPPATLPATPTAAVALSPTTATPQATPPPAPQTPALPGTAAPPQTIRLVEIATGRTTTVFESGDSIPTALTFDGDQIVLDLVPRGAGGQAVRSRRTFDGTELSRLPLGQATGACTEAGPDIQIAGRRYSDAACGPISPDRRWMTYQIAAGDVTTPFGFTVPSWDQWALNLATDERILLQTGLRNCGGCDGRFGPTWSPSGRYLYFSEWLAGGRVFLSDLQTGATRLLHEGSTELTAEPDWSPATDLLIYPDAAAATTILEDPATGVRTPLPVLPWPARFDPTGAYLYSPAWPDPRDTLHTTTVYHLTSRATAFLPGRPSQGNLWQDEQPVTGAGATFIATLYNADGCAGAAVYRGDTRLACIPGGEAARPAPNADVVAVARLTGPAVASSLNTYEVLLIDMVSGRLRPLITDLRGPAPPHLAWNNAGSHLLVHTPATRPGP